MDNDAQATAPATPILPRAKPFESSAALAAATPPGPQVDASAAPEGPDRAGVFQHLVSGDSDIAGLVAYSIYKQNKLDWLRAFQASVGRAPTDAELASYIVGEGTPRRLATYRHLAEATLSGNGPSVAEGQTHGVASPRRPPTNPGLFSPALIAIYALIGVLFVFGFWLALHFTLTSR